MFSNELSASIISLDIETSGLDKKKDWIWSIGTSRAGARSEHFIRNPDVSKAPSLMSPQNDIFGIDGYFDNYKASLRSGSAVTKTDAIRSVFEDVGRDSTVLIQNVNFENSHIANAMGPQEALEHGSQFQFRTQDNNGRILSKPPDVIKAVQSASRQSLAVMKSGDASLLSSLNNTYSEMIDAYNQSFANRSGSIVMDLMDVTKATYATAASKGLMSHQHIESGLSVSFLSRALLGATEEHTAAADADYQEQIFKRMSGIYSGAQSGSLSDTDRAALSKIKSAQPLESSRVFLSSLRSSLNEIHTTGSTKLIDPSVVRLADRTISGVEHRFTETDYRMAPHTPSPSEAVAHVIGRFQNRGMKGLHAESYGQSLQDLPLADQISKIESDQKLFDQKVTRKLTGNYSNAESIRDSLGGISRRSLKKMGLGAASALAAGLLTMDSEKSTSSRRRLRSGNQAADKGKSMKMFSDYTVHHGTGIYLSDNAVSHHNY